MLSEPSSARSPPFLRRLEGRPFQPLCYSCEHGGPGSQMATAEDMVFRILSIWKKSGPPIAKAREALGVSASSSEHDINKAYRKMVLHLHPDKCDLPQVRARPPARLRARPSLAQMDACMRAHARAQAVPRSSLALMCARTVGCRRLQGRRRRQADASQLHQRQQGPRRSPSDAATARWVRPSPPGAGGGATTTCGLQPAIRAAAAHGRSTSPATASSCCAAAARHRSVRAARHRTGGGIGAKAPTAYCHAVGCRDWRSRGEAAKG